MDDHVRLCACGLHKISIGDGGVIWHWSRHSELICMMTEPDGPCWCGIAKSMHWNGHAPRAVHIASRRIVKPQPRLVDVEPRFRPHTWGFFGDAPAGSKISEGWPENGRVVRCPYGDPGDRLWVKEGIRRDPIGVRSTYIADGEATVADAWPWKNSALPSIHCPRGLSRITLEITGVRVERLQDITEADVIAEGVTVPLAANLTGIPWSDIPTLHDAWRLLWNHINGERADWDSNCWVWRVAFRRIHG